MTKRSNLLAARRGVWCRNPKDLLAGMCLAGAGTSRTAERCGCEKRNGRWEGSLDIFLFGGYVHMHKLAQTA